MKLRTFKNFSAIAIAYLGLVSNGQSASLDPISQNAITDNSICANNQLKVLREQYKKTSFKNKRKIRKLIKNVSGLYFTNSDSLVINSKYRIYCYDKTLYGNIVPSDDSTVRPIVVEFTDSSVPTAETDWNGLNVMTLNSGSKLTASETVTYRMILETKTCKDVLQKITSFDDLENSSFVFQKVDDGYKNNFNQDNGTLKFSVIKEHESDQIVEFNLKQSIDEDYKRIGSGYCTSISLPEFVNFIQVNAPIDQKENPNHNRGNGPIKNETIATQKQLPESGSAN